MSAGVSERPVARSDAATGAPTAVAQDAGSRRIPQWAMPVMALAVLVSFAALDFRHAIPASILAATLVALSAIDIEHGVIPNRIVLPAAAVVLCVQLALFPGDALEWTLAPLAAAVVLALPGLLGRAWMGMGDVKLALLIGAGLGWDVFGALVLAFLCVFPVALAVVARRRLEARRATIPFGPFFSLGALILLFAPHLGSL
jgi:leader peptidase (prepilin peptidase) / N-methyltransferase